MIRQVLLGLGLGLALFTGLAVVKFFQIKAAIAEGALHQPPPDSVSVVTVAPSKWSNEIRAMGSFVPEQGAVLAVEDLARVAAIRFTPGQSVKQGDVLVEFDVSVERAQVKAAEAQRDMAQLEMARQQQLASKGAGSKAVQESAQAAYRTAVAEVERVNSLIRRKTIIAPFAGKTGTRLVNPGEVLQPGTPVVSLQSLERLLLNFSLPQHRVSQIQPGQVVRVSVDGFPNEQFSGAISAIDPNVNPSTRNVNVQAVVPNPADRLRSGMYADISLVLSDSRDVIAVPAPSVLFAPYGDSVYVLGKLKDKDGKEYLGVQPQIIKLGERRGDFVEVLSGLSIGQEIVAAGVFKLRPGAPVNVVPENPAPAELQPAPQNT